MLPRRQKPGRVDQRSSGNAYLKKKRSILITRDLTKGSIFQQLLSQRGCIVKGTSLIEIEYVEVELPKTEWIFFSSRNSVRSIGQKQSIKGYKVAALSTGTADELIQFGYSPSYVGGQLPTPEIAAHFLQEHQPKSIFFPISNRSKKQVQKTIADLDSSAILKEGITYLNQPKPFSVKDYDVVVFTSPSQVESYFSANAWKATQKAVAMGVSTQSALLKHGVTNAVQSWGYSDWALVDAV